ncbi:hypothetical protein RVR_4524 [Actinacidiphila reveromycinica]|uniref:Uncharacterized protein n=1 Tax=Actinacidiphila reveromycinica TaxID=659352 RepID=A0A7U3UQ78_9ACTN|nr:hypothetical protein [Streptomyces sp. SN-593]BBA98370.1 hypothetical protein RVR_4524 [Streptomyces sp. SN-593]
MLSAAEATLEQGAEDEADWRRIKAKLYAPPKGQRGPQRRARPPGMGMDMGQAQSLAAQLAAEDARMTGSRTG